MARGAEGIRFSSKSSYISKGSALSAPNLREMTKLAWMLSLLFSFLTFAVLVLGQPGFISIDCGIAENSTYQDSNTGINYSSDAGFIDTGENRNISDSDTLDSLRQYYKNVRSFPNGSRNCYTLKPVNKGNKYLIRASFYYGNYDGKNSMPQFDLYIGINRWATYNGSKARYYEIITVASMEFVSVCLVNTGFGTPFISALELRLLKSSMYTASNESQSLRLNERYDIGSTTNKEIRYPTDPYDMIWKPFTLTFFWIPFSTSLQVTTDKYEGFEPPPTVMMSAVKPLNDSDTLYFTWSADDPTLQFHVYRHFAELESLQPNMTREFTLCCNESCYRSFSPEYLVATTVYTIQPLSGQDLYMCTITKTLKSTLPPILNAIETYTVLQLDTTQTDTQDVEAIIDIRDIYKVKKNWVGDPCLPKNYPWEGLNCSYPLSTAPRIISLNLSSTGLNGKIAASFDNLTLLESLDLSGNYLTGPVPNFLEDLSSLSLLNLTGNQLNGLVPSILLERSKKGSLKLSVDDNPNLCLSDPCGITTNDSASNNRNKRKTIIPIVASVASAVILLALLIILWAFKWRKQDPVTKANKADGLTHNKQNIKNGSLRSENRQFTYAEIVTMTNNFQRPIGKGGFGTVYYGQMRDGTQVAVKMLPLQSIKLLSQPCQGSNEFQNEAQLLMRVHHRNIVPFIGYCQEGDNMALIYEYMAQGNLGRHLSGKDSNSIALTWGQRLHIALDVAQGLEYLHNGCKPPIIHRDMKTTNILLNERLEAKIGDFGLSKVFLNEEFTHISTAVKGTLGYLDPEYCISNNLTEKSDVYSFGVVLLELITGKPAIIQISESERKSITDWASPMVSGGDIRRVIDPRFEDNYDINSIWKAVEIALACTPPRSIQRPTMSDVVAELKECLGTEIATERSRTSENGQMETSSSISYYPLPR